MESRDLRISLMVKTRYFLYIIAGSVIFASCRYGNGSVLSFISRVTKISIPRHISTVAEFDQGEFEAGGKYQLQQEDIGKFLSSNPFRHVEDQYLCRFNFYCKAGLIPRSDSIPISTSSHLKYFTGCKEGNAWRFTLNEKSGELWIEVEYSDFSGQGPACKL